MAKIKIKLLKYRRVPRGATLHGLGELVIMVLHGGSTCRLRTDYRLRDDEWDDRSSGISFGSQSPDRLDYLMRVQESLRRDMERIGRIVRRLDERGLPYSASDIAGEYRRFVHECSLVRFMGELIARLRLAGKRRTAEIYAATLRSFSTFLSSGGGDIVMDCMDRQLMELYEGFLRGRGLTPNTSSFYMRVLRAVYNRAADCGMIEQRNPFRHVYTGVERTVKRALGLAELKAIKRLDLSDTPALDYARDMFMMSFYTRGMAFIDMAFLRKSDLRGGYLSYRRRKTGQRLSVEWTDEMQLILDKYPENPTKYLLPVIRSDSVNEFWCYRNTAYNINYSLKKIAMMVGVSMPLTLYCARHSWATAAREHGVPVSVISEGMGHGSESTTRIYLASLDASTVDCANRMIIRSL